jgi:hypothetical protein
LCMEYVVLDNKKEWKSGEYSLVPLREEDIFLIKKWRNEQIDVLRQKKPLSDDDQRAYYHEVIQPLFRHAAPDQILFSFLHSNTCIGYGGLVHIDWSKREGEVSFLVDTVRAGNPEVYERVFNIFLSLIKSIAFDELKMNRICTEVYDIRPLHVSILENNGFVLKKRLKNFLVIRGKPVDSLLHECMRKNYDTCVSD